MSDKRQKNQLQMALAFTGEGRSEAPKAPREGTESLTAKCETESPAGEEQLMEEVCGRENCQRALRRVKANKGSPGIDGMKVSELPGYLKQHWPAIREQLLSGTYQPQPVRRVEIAKPDGGMRKLGIPTVLDRFDPAGGDAGSARQMGPGRSPNTVTGFVRNARRIRRWPRRSSISPRATAGWWTSIWKSFLIE